MALSRICGLPKATPKAGATTVVRVGSRGWRNAGLGHHSDRGVQYASQLYRQNLNAAGVISRLSRRGNGYDNAAMESFWSALKRELVYQRRFATRGEARAAIFEWIEVFYNRVRLHSALGYHSPVDFETKLN